jgi:hypothetical protein
MRAASIRYESGKPVIIADFPAATTGQLSYKGRERERKDTRTAARADQEQAANPKPDSTPIFFCG